MKTMNYILQTIGLGAAIVAISVSAQAAGTGRNMTTQSVTVSYGDLNLSHQAGIATLYSRLRAAAGRVCAPEPDGRDLDKRDYWKQCFNQAMDNAVAGINNPALTQAHFSRTGRMVDNGQRVAKSN